MPVVALAPLDIILIALMVMLLAFAALELGKFLGQLFSHVPVIGGWVGSHLVGLTDGAAKWVWKKLSGFASMSKGWLLDAYHAMKAAYVQQIALAYETATTLWHIATVQIPREIGAAKAYALAKVAAARDYAGNLVDAATSDLVGRIAAARSYAASLVAAARSDAAAALGALRDNVGALFAAAEGAAAAEVAAAEAKALGLFKVAEADALAATKALEASVAARVAAVEAEALAGVKAAEDAAQALSQAAVLEAGVITDLVGVKALEGVWEDLIDGAGAVAGELVPDLSGLEDLLKGLSGAKLAGLASVLAALGVLSLAQVKALEKCILPNCRNLGPLAKFLEALLGDVEDAALLAFIILMATDPQGAAGVIDDVAGPIVSGTTAGLRDLIGV